MTTSTPSNGPTPALDAIIIGAGVSGLHQLHRLRELGLRVQVFEAGTGVGGTWYWNRYPGARFDSESYTYGYSFSEEILAEWRWSEHFAPQPETLRYLNFVADKLDLRSDITFGAFVTSATFDEASNTWTVTLADGRTATSRLLITALGPLSVPTLPVIEGRDSFRGEAHHTGLWPHEPVDFAGKRVGVIGTGASGVQVIQEVAKTAEHLTVFQRTPNWCAPLHNSVIDEATQAHIVATQHEIFERCRQTYGQFIHDSVRAKAVDTPPQERDAFYEKLYNEPGFGIWMANYRDVLVDEVANRTISEFVAAKIRSRVDDPAIAEALIPTNHGFGTRRVPLETNYYEVYNQPNVDLVDLRRTPISRITPAGVTTSDGDHEFDLLIYATGFAAVTGAFERITFTGPGGVTLADTWADGPRTFLGMTVAGFPNLFTLVGPHSAGTFCNIPRCIEQNVDWVTDLIDHATRNGVSRIEATAEAQDAWTDEVVAAADRMLLSKVDSWFTGVNKNRSDRQERTVVLYTSGAPAYKQRCEEVAANGYEGFTLTP